MAKKGLRAMSHGDLNTWQVSDGCHTIVMLSIIP